MGMMSLRRRALERKGGRDFSKEYLTFEALENSTFKLTGNDIDYSIDGGSTWVTLPAGTDSPVISTGNTIMWRRISSYVYAGSGTFSSTGNYIVYGNSMSIVYGQEYRQKTSFGGNNVFKFLFKGDTHIVSAHDMILPAITLTGACYYQMFMGCSNLIDAPDLPFTSLTGYEQCLQMFSGCVNLQTPIVLLPETLMRNSYFAMFQNCRKINDVTIMATDISANNCLYLWLTGVAASGTFTKKTGVTYPSGSSGIPNGWTVIEI